MPLRVLLDVNVWVNHFLSLSRGKAGSAASQLAGAAIDGHCRLGPMQVIASHAMLDTLQGVLERIGLSERQAQVARDVIETACEAGPLRMPPVAVLGSAVQPMLDEEDRAVLDTAIAAGAELLITNNMGDFTRGPRTRLDAWQAAEGVLVLSHPKVPEGLVIASVFNARAWLVHGVPFPQGVPARLSPGNKGIMAPA